MGPTANRPLLGVGGGKAAVQTGMEQSSNRPHFGHREQSLKSLKAAIRCPYDDRGNAPHIGRSELQKSVS
jgi:hypothetical protein